MLKLTIALILSFSPLFLIRGQSLTGKWGPPRTNVFGVRAEIKDEGSYQLQKSSGLFTNWVVATNFNSLPALVDFEETISGGLRLYRLIRSTVPVAITSHSAGATNFFNEQITLQATVTGSWPLRFQWYKNGQALAGANTNKLVFTGRTENSGNYSLLVSNLWSVALSPPITVKVINPVAPTVSGKKLRFVIETIQGNFIHRGTYDTRFDPTGFYTTQSSNVYLNDTGYWQYQILNENTARVPLPNSITYPNGVLGLVFQTTTNGSYSLVVPGWSGSQSGKFIFDVP
jgi:hypothetical protein